MGGKSPDPTWILHVDLDQFLAAVEQQRRPELQGKPVVVAATSDLSRRRAVVATASYEAREYGIRSGMSMRTATKRCPDAIFLPSDRPAYDAVSERVMATLRSFRAVVEVLGWDEAFVGGEIADPERLAADIQQAVFTSTGLSCAVGIGDNKLRAKVATGFAKPGGFFRLTADNWMEVMGQLATDALWGIGPKTSRKLADVNLTTVAQLAAADPVMLAERFGPTMGPHYRLLARGAGVATVTAEPRTSRSRSHEVTFDHDLADRIELDRQVATFARRLAHEAADDARSVARVAVKVRFAPFTTRTRSMMLSAPTVDADTIERAALVVLDRFEHHRAVRLVGVRVEFADAAEAEGCAEVGQRR